MPPNPLSRVNQVELNADDNTVEIDLQVYGFNDGTPVEISGYATQENGAVAAFHEIQEVTAVNQGVAQLQLTAVGIEKQPFVSEDPIMVIANATASWITTLQPEDATSGDKPRWSKPQANYAVRPPPH